MPSRAWVSLLPESLLSLGVIFAGVNAFSSLPFEGYRLIAENRAFADGITLKGVPDGRCDFFPADFLTGINESLEDQQNFSRDNAFSKS